MSEETKPIVGAYGAYMGEKAVTNTPRMNATDTPVTDAVAALIPRRIEQAPYVDPREKLKAYPEMLALFDKATNKPTALGEAFAAIPGDCKRPPEELAAIKAEAAAARPEPELYPFEDAKKQFADIAAANAAVAAAPTGYPDGNPKTAVGARKPSFHAIPTSALIPMGQAMADGCTKYGLTNWREFPVSSSVYYNAMLRHLFAWWDGEDVADDSGVHHLGHVMACAAILMDARSLAKLNDDRPKYPGAFARITTEIAETGKTSLAPL